MPNSHGINLLEKIKSPLRIAGTTIATAALIITNLVYGFPLEPPKVNDYAQPKISSINEDEDTLPEIATKLDNNKKNKKKRVKSRSLKNPNPAYSKRPIIRPTREQPLESRLDVSSDSGVLQQTIQNPGANHTCYVVKQDDTLTEILEMHGLDPSNTSEIAVFNNIQNPYTISVGQQICWSTYKNTLPSKGVIPMYLTYYDPTKGGDNCSTGCNTNWIGDEILDEHGRPNGKGWYDPQRLSASVACSKLFPINTQFELDLPTGETVKFRCRDRGVEGNQLDILHRDGYSEDQTDKYNPPETPKGALLHGGPFYIRYKIPENNI